MTAVCKASTSSTSGVGPPGRPSKSCGWFWWEAAGGTGPVPTVIPAVLKLLKESTARGTWGPLNQIVPPRLWESGI